MTVRFAPLSAVALAALLPLLASAQAKIDTHAAHDTLHGAFVVAEVSGAASCREATPEEARILNQVPQVRTTVFGENRSRIRANDAGEAHGLNIILRGTEQLDAQPEAKAAFERAAAILESRIANPITVYVDVDYGTKRFGVEYSSANIIGSTSSSSWLFDPGDYKDLKPLMVERADNPVEAELYSKLPSVNVPTDIVANGGLIDRFAAVSMLLRAFAVFPPNANDDPTDPDPAKNIAKQRSPNIGFNSGFSFDFNPDDGITGGRTDFIAVAVHEMGHMLGFVSRVGAGELQSTEAPAILDLFRFRPGVDLGTFETAQRVLTTTGDQVFFGGGGSYLLSTGNSRGENGDGQQASHWKDDGQAPFVHIGLMDPTLSRGRRLELTRYDLEAFDTMGYTLRSPGCVELEPNSSRGDANSIPYDTPCSGTAGHTEDSTDSADGRLQDFYNVTIPSSGKLEVVLNFSNAAANLNVFLLNADGSTLASSKGTNTTEILLTNTLPAGTYTVAVSSVEGTSSYVFVASAIGLLPPPPSAPSALSATTLSVSSVRLNWTDNATNETEFRIEQKDAGGSYSDIGSVPENTTTFTVTGLGASTTTAFRIRARNAGGDSGYTAEVSATTPPVASPCVVNSTTACLLSDRFKVVINYLNQFASPPQPGLFLASRLLPGVQNPDTATFGFGSAQAIEAVVRIQDARPFGAERFDLYFGGMTDVEYTITVQDTVTGTTRQYRNPPGTVGGGVDRSSFPSNGSFTPAFALIQSTSVNRAPIVRANAAPSTCTANQNTLCLVDNRFQVKIDYLNQFASPPQPGSLLGARLLTGVQNPDTGIFGFGSPQAIEAVVRIQDARPFGVQRFDVYYGGMTDVEYTVTVTDTVTGTSRQYRNPPGAVGGGVDRASFPAN